MSLVNHVWEYGRRELPYLAQALMELALFTPFCLAFMPWASLWSVPQFFLFLLGLVLIPFNLIRFLSLVEVPINQQRTILLIGLAVMIFTSMRTLLYTPESLFDLSWIGEFFTHIRSSGYPFWARDFIVLGIVVYLWWRGIRLVDRSRDIDMIGLQFRVRALLFAPLVIYFGSFRLAWSLTPFVLLFCFASLILIALARAEQVELETSGLSFPVTLSWLSVVGGAGLVIVFAGVLLASATTSESVFGPPQAAVRFASYSIFYTFINVVGPTFFVLFERLASLFEFLLAPIAAAIANIQFTLPDAINQGVEGSEISQAPELLVNVTQIAFTVAAVVLVIAFIAVIIFGLIASVRTLQNAQQRTAVLRAPHEDDLRDEDEQTLWERLKGLLPRLRDWRTAASIRRIYKQMVYAATAVGYPRHVTETPYEYLHRLRELWPQNVTETTLITDAYIRVHYGELPETRSELDDIYNAWQNLEMQIRQTESQG